MSKPKCRWRFRTGPALFAGGGYVGQLWLFWFAPLLAAALAGLVAQWLYEPVLVTKNGVVMEAETRIG